MMSFFGDVCTGIPMSAVPPLIAAKGNRHLAHVEQFKRNRINVIARAHRMLSLHRSENAVVIAMGPSSRIVHPSR